MLEPPIGQQPVDLFVELRRFPAELSLWNHGAVDDEAFGEVLQVG